MTMIVSRSSGGAMTPIRELGLRLTVSVCLIYERNTERERERERESVFTGHIIFLYLNARFKGF